MVKRKYYEFKKGDVIRTNPEEGFYGVAVVLDDGKRLEEQPGKFSCPMCHIAITPLIYDYEITMDEINIDKLHPLIFQRCFSLKGKPEFYREELLIHIYTTRNIIDLPIKSNVTRCQARCDARHVVTRCDEIKPKYKVIGTHTGRRSFICNALSMGIAPQVVMKWTGHNDYKAMKPYIDVCDEIKAKLQGQ